MLTHELLEEGRSMLRCMEWKDLTLELLASGPICGVTDASLARNEFLAKSRPVAPNEQIDFFLSHAWVDDPEAKFEALSDFVADFKRRCNRDPTFWFDKTCIDQQRLADGLRVLPVTIMACDKVLMLYGHHYTRRLWCMWELFTVVAFAPIDMAMEKIVPLSVAIPASPGANLQTEEDDIDGEGKSPPFESFCTFSSADSKCFDPNDERRLKKVIRAVGQAYFDKRIRHLGQVCRKQEEERLRVSPAAVCRLSTLSSPTAVCRWSTLSPQSEAAV